MVQFIENLDIKEKFYVLFLCSYSIILENMEVILKEYELFY